MKYYNVELKGTDAKRFRGWLMDMHIKYEPSDAGYGYTHFEVLLSPEMKEKADDFLRRMA